MTNAKHKKSTPNPTPKAKAKSKPAVDEIETLVAKVCAGGTAKLRVALRDSPAKDAVPHLVARFTDADSKVRSNALEHATSILAFAKLVPVDAIIVALGDPEPNVRLAAVVCLKRCFPIDAYYKPHAAKIRPALEPLLEDNDDRVAEHAGHAWELLGLG